jgi:hypothetical protein
MAEVIITRGFGEGEEESLIGIIVSELNVVVKTHPTINCTIETIETINVRIEESAYNCNEQ